MKRRRSIPQALLRLRIKSAGASQADDSAGASQPRRRLTRAIRRLRDTFQGVMPDARDIDAANDSEK
jgi:hypothetical protein